MPKSDRPRYLVAGVLLLIVGSWLVADITRGDWLLVKKHLTAGEGRAIYSRMLRQGESGDQINSAKVGMSRVLGYLLDWSITDADDKPVPILNQPEDVVAAALDNLELESFTEILTAIDAHIAAMEQAREAERKNFTGGTASSAISPSAESSTGGTNGFSSSTETSTTS